MSPEFLENTNLTTSDLISGRARMYEKEIEIKKRGLLSSPEVSEEDLHNIHRIGRIRHRINNRVLQLPNIPLKIKISSLLTDDMVYYLAMGDYEQSDLNLLKNIIKKNNKTMNIGCGAGICASYMSYLSEMPVIVVDASPKFESLIFENFNLNNLSGNFIHALLNDNFNDDDKIDFYIRDNFFYSSQELLSNMNNRNELESLFKANRIINKERLEHLNQNCDSEKKCEKISVPVINLNTLYDKYLPDVVLIDIRGGELFVNFDTSYKPRYLLIEIHAPIFGSKETCHVLQKIIDVGYKVKNFDFQTWLFKYGK